MGDRRAAVLLGALVLAGLIVFSGQRPLDTHHDQWRGPHVSSDGWYYYHELRSLALDRDLDLTNEYEQFGNWYGFKRSKAGRPRNPFGVGPAVAWMPGFVIGHGVALAKNDPELWRRPEGYAPAEQYGALLISYLAGALTLVLGYVFARRFAGPVPALLGTVGAVLGGPLLWYAIYEPSMPHALAAASASAFLCVALPIRGAPGRSLAGFAGLGVLGGLAMLMRPQHGVLLAIPLAELSLFAFRTRELRRALVTALAMLALAAVVFGPQMLAWHAIYGRFLVIPQGEGFMRWESSMWSEVLFSSRNGLFTSTPILWLTLPGLIVLGRRHRQPALVLGVLLLSQAFINGAAWDWWGGGAYGGRRMLGSSLLFAVAIAVCVAPIVAGRRHGTVKIAVAIAFVSAFVGPQLAVLSAYLDKSIKLDDPSPVAVKFAPALGSGVVSVFDRIGNPFAFPANAMFSIQNGVPLSRYDYAVGPYLLNERVPTTNPLRPRKSTDDARLSPPSGFAFAGAGVEPTPEGGRIEAAGTVFVPLNRPGSLRAKLFIYCDQPVSGLLRFEDLPATPLSLAPPGKAVPLSIPAEAIGRGVHRLRIEVDGPVVVQHLLLTEGDDWPPTWVRDAP